MLRYLDSEYEIDLKGINLESFQDDSDLDFRGITGNNFGSITNEIKKCIRVSIWLPNLKILKINFQFTLFEDYPRNN